MIERKGDWMQTVSGRKFWPIDPKPEEIYIEDIAHALAMMCRFNGHCTRFYSVGEHSLIISHMVPVEDALWGLLHDASEAYIADIVKPAKPHIQGYMEVEARIMGSVAKRFGLPEVMPKSVKAADRILLADEAEQIMGPKPENWNLGVEPQGWSINGDSPMVVKENFLQRYKQLGGSYAK